jgi:hypothetical protein
MVAISPTKRFIGFQNKQLFFLPNDIGRGDKKIVLNTI